MMMRLGLLVALVLATPVWAQSVKLKAHEIEALLSGNTAIGTWAGAPYRQYFDPNGRTIYAQEGARSTSGEWRVDPLRDEYQSIWPRDAEWEGWFVMEYAGDFYWVSKSTPPTSFKVLDGQALVAETTAGARCSTIASWSEGDDAAIRVLVSSPAPAQCGTSLGLSGSVAQHCAWGFDYRAEAAQQQMEALSEMLTGCFGVPTPNAEPLVNHPDSYALHSFQTPGGTVSASLKDKGALQQTFIFLRLERRSD